MGAKWQGRDVYDLPDAPRPGEDTPSHVRYLYDFDNLLLSHADRSRVNTHNLLELGWTADGPQPSCLLVDGRVEATWLIEKHGGSAVLNITPLAKLGATVRDDIVHEGVRLLTFLGHDPASADIRFRD